MSTGSVPPPPDLPPKKRAYVALLRVAKMHAVAAVCCIVGDGWAYHHLWLLECTGMLVGAVGGWRDLDTSLIRAAEVEEGAAPFPPS